MEDNLKTFSEGLIKNLNGLTNLMQKTLEDGLAELKKKDPIMGEEKAKEFAEAMKSGKLSEKMKDFEDALSKIVKPND